MPKLTRIIPAPGTRVIAQKVGRDGRTNGAPVILADSEYGQTILVTGNFVTEDVDTDRYVTVALMSTSGRDGGEWTYRDPSGTLEKGDVVGVPFGYSNYVMTGKVLRRLDAQDAQVQALKDTGTRIKDVASLFTADEL